VLPPFLADGALRPPIPRASWIAAATLIGLAVTGTVLSDRPGEGLRGELAPDFRIRPAVRHDLDEVRRLLAHLDQRLAVAPGWVYVIAVHGPLTDTGLGFANLFSAPVAAPASYLVGR
jgi:hypothetical protein